MRIFLRVRDGDVGKFYVEILIHAVQGARDAAINIQNVNKF